MIMFTELSKNKRSISYIGMNNSIFGVLICTVKIRHPKQIIQIFLKINKWDLPTENAIYDNNLLIQIVHLRFFKISAWNLFWKFCKIHVCILIIINKFSWNRCSIFKWNWKERYPEGSSHLPINGIKYLKLHFDHS